MPGWLCLGATPNTLEKLEDREVSLSAFWRRLKRVISGGGEQWRFAGCHLVVRGYTARHVVITGGEPCIHDLLPLTDLLEKNGFSCQIETSGTHEVRCTPNTGLPYRQSWTRAAAMKCCHRHWSEPTKSSIQWDAYVILKHWMNWQRWPMINCESLHCSRLARRMMPHVCALKPALRVTGVCRCKHINI